MSLDLLLDDEQYHALVGQVKTFAEKNGFELLPNSKGLVQIATTMMLAVELEDEAFIMLSKLIYNIGYRDNNFKNLSVH